MYIYLFFSNEFGIYLFAGKELTYKTSQPPYTIPNLVPPYRDELDNSHIEINSPRHFLRHSLNDPE